MTQELEVGANRSSTLGLPGPKSAVRARAWGSDDVGVDLRQYGRVERIRDYLFGHVVVDGQTHTRDLIVLPARVVANWWRREGHSLVLEDLAEVIDELPERLLVGAGATSQMRPDPGALEALRRRGIEVEVLATTKAVRRFAECDPARTAAALHLTC